MKLIARVADAGTTGGKALMLFDEAGAPLPLQLACDLRQSVEGSTITVTFGIDGKNVALAESVPGAGVITYQPLDGPEVRHKAG